MHDLAEASTWKPNSRSYAKFFSDATAKLPPVSHHHNMLSEVHTKPSGFTSSRMSTCHLSRHFASLSLECALIRDPVHQPLRLSLLSP